MQGVRARIKAITAPRHRLPEAVEPLVNERHGLLRGWGASFRVGNATAKLQQVDGYVRQRLRLLLSKKTGRRDRDRRQRWYADAYFDRRGLHRLVGTVRWHRVAPTGAR